MENSQNIIRKSFIGYKKKHVDLYLKSSLEEENKKISEIKDKINEILKLNEELSIEVENIKLDREINGKTEDYKDFLMKRLENIQEFMNTHGQKEIKYLKEDVKNKEVAIEKEIQQLNRFFKNIQNNLDILIKTVVIKHEGEIEEGKESSFRVIPYKARSTNRKMLQNDNEPEKMLLAQNDIIRDFNDVDEIRDKLILGKLAGEDLITEEGKKIILKDSIITEELLQRAEDAGKLSELIIKMATPEDEK